MISSLLLAAALNAAYSQPAPVQVAACSLEQTPALNIPFGNSAPSIGTLSISFANQDAKTVKSVAFNVTDGHTTEQVVENGTFSQDVRIDKLETAAAFTNDFSQVSCTVSSVAFADGSVWQAQ
jgi:hypothetical protein